MQYLEALEYLYTSRPAFHLIGAAAYKPGLENTYRLMEHIGNPHKGLRCVHIAGTNGKGSTSHLIAASLQAAGLKVGLYTSPHLVDFRERIRINGNMIPESCVADFVERHRAFLDELKPSFFETTMAMAFDYFAKQHVDIAVIEVGLGGRLDSTNIITPLLSVITNIGFDHTEFLGNTLPLIAAEKAGIIKKGIPCIIGERDPQTADVFIQKAKEEQAPITFAGQAAKMPDMPCQLQGNYQIHNKQTAYTALTTLGIDPAAIQKGFAQVCTMTGLRGRWEIIADQPRIICDTGHNSHGIKYVADQLSNMNTDTGKLYIVFGMVDDKDVDVVLQLLPKKAHYLFTQAQTHRAIPADKLAQMASKQDLHGESYSSVEQAIQAALQLARKEDSIFIGGSNYIVGEALRTLS